jgi:DNA polymerase-3 subunit delta
MTFEQFTQAVHNDRLPSLLLLQSEESYFLDQAVRLASGLVPSEFRDFNLTVLHGRDLKGSELADQARTLPVFSDRRVIIVKNLNEAPADQLEIFSAYLDDPVPETQLLITTATIDKRRKFFQKFAQKGEIVEFRKFYENQIPLFVREQAKGYGRTFTGPALSLFCRRLGSNLAEIVGEIEKLVSYVGDRDFFEEDDVAAIVADTRTESVFALIDALCAGQTGEALRLLDRLIGDGQPPLVILTMLTRHFRQLWKTRSLLAQGVAQKDLSRQIGINPYFLNNLLAQANRYADAQLRDIFPRLLAVDQALKSSGDPRGYLENLLFALTARAATERR